MLHTKDEKRSVIKLSLIAPTGYGKTTAARIIRDMYGSVNVKLSQPLYDLQKIIYSFIGKEIGEKQDGELLQFLGKKIQEERPDFLAQSFYQRMIKLIYIGNVKIITNDDCRPHNYKYLKKWGFLFVKIDGFHKSRNDYTKVDPNNPIEWDRNFTDYDYILENKGDLLEYRYNIRKLMKEVFDV